MFNKVINFMYGLRDRQRILIGLTKGSAMMSARNIVNHDPDTWEFSGFSQNGEDGILDVLRKNLLQSNRYFIEIGAADGIDNNSAWLTIVEKYRGLMIEGNSALVERAKRMIGQYSLGLHCLNMFVEPKSVKAIKSAALFLDPDVLSLDIDGIDYYVAEALLAEKFRPKIFVVEYNAVFGPSLSKTIQYTDSFDFSKAHSSQLYFGVSIAAWKKFFVKQGYQFVTVDRNGVNAFFVDPSYFNANFLDDIKSRAFAENQYQVQKFGVGYEKQFKMIEHLCFQDI